MPLASLFGYSRPARGADTPIPPGPHVPSSADIRRSPTTFYRFRCKACRTAVIPTRFPHHQDAARAPQPPTGDSTIPSETATSETYKTVRDVVEQTRGFHQRVADLYDNGNNGSQDERVQRLLEVLERRQRTVQQTLDAYDPDDAEAILDTWLQYVPSDDVQRALADAEIDSDTNIDDVIETTMRVDQALVTMHRNLAEAANAPRVQEFFSSLAQLEEREDERAAWAVLTTHEA